MEKGNIKMDEYMAEQLEREDEEEGRKEASPRPKKNEDGRTDPAEDVPAPTDVDDEDITLGEFSNKRKGIAVD